MHADNCSISGNSCCSRSVSIPTENLTYSVLSLFGLDHMCIFQAIELKSQSGSLIMYKLYTLFGLCCRNVSLFGQRLYVVNARI